jgi:hypothetical protein
MRSQLNLIKKCASACMSRLLIPPSTQASDHSQLESTLKLNHEWICLRLSFSHRRFCTGVRTIRRIRMTMMRWLVLVGSFRRRRRGVGEDSGAAERAGGVGAEPRVDAARVEAVPAARQQAALVAVRELRDADRALGRRPADADAGGGVHEDGQRGDGQLHLAPVPGLGRRRRRRGLRRRRRPIGRVVVLAAAAAARSRAREEAPEVGVDEEDEEDVEHDEARREKPPVCLPVDAGGGGGAWAGAHGHGCRLTHSVGFGSLSTRPGSSLTVRRIRSKSKYANHSYRRPDHTIRRNGKLGKWIDTAEMTTRIYIYT